MIPMSLADVARAMGAVGEPSYERIVVGRVSTDSRNVAEGDLFFALRGERVDGHRFVPQACAKGAAACVCARDWSGPAAGGSDVPRVMVDDPVAALGRLAAHYRRGVMPSSTAVVAVTGSNGKTTTKGMIGHVLGASLKGRCAPKSFNNSIGVPLTLLSSDSDDRYLVTEIGTNAPGEVASLAAIAAPDVAVITSIGEAHLEGLGDIQAIAAEKASLLDYVHSEGFAVVNADRPEVRRYLYRELPARMWTFGFEPHVRLRVSHVQGGLRGTTFCLEGRHRLGLTFPGLHHATNAVAAFAVARWFGIAPAEIIERLASFAPAEGRTRLFEVGGVTLVDDTYNANPSSMVAAIETLRRAEGNRRVLVMGDMFELGARTAALHREVLQSACAAGLDVLVAVGEAMIKGSQAIDPRGPIPQVFSCEDADAAGEALTTILSPGDTVWIKASRAMGLDRVVRYLEAHYGSRSAVA